MPIFVGGKSILLLRGNPRKSARGRERKKPLLPPCIDAPGAPGSPKRALLAFAREKCNFSKKQLDKLLGKQLRLNINLGYGGY